MNELIDSLGNELVTGDVVLESKGFGTDDKKGYYQMMKVYEVPEVLDGRGITYNYDGSKSYFYWASFSNSCKIDLDSMPDGFGYSFKHGMTDIYSFTKGNSLEEILENLYWEDNLVKEESVEKYIFLKSIDINSVEDVNSNLEMLLRIGNTPEKTKRQVLRVLASVNKNYDEKQIGEHWLQDSFDYGMLIYLLGKNPDYLNNCKKSKNE